MHYASPLLGRGVFLCFLLLQAMPVLEGFAGWIDRYSCAQVGRGGHVVRNPEGFETTSFWLTMSCAARYS